MHTTNTTLAQRTGYRRLLRKAAGGGICRHRGSPPSQILEANIHPPRAQGTYSCLPTRFDNKNADRIKFSGLPHPTRKRPDSSSFTKTSATKSVTAAVFAAGLGLVWMASRVPSNSHRFYSKSLKGRGITEL